MKRTKIVLLMLICSSVAFAQDAGNLYVTFWRDSSGYLVPVNGKNLGPISTTKIVALFTGGGYAGQFGTTNNPISLGATATGLALVDSATGHTANLVEYGNVTSSFSSRFMFVNKPAVALSGGRIGEIDVMTDNGSSGWFQFQTRNATSAMNNSFAIDTGFIWIALGRPAAVANFYVQNGLTTGGQQLANFEYFVNRDGVFKYRRDSTGVDVGIAGVQRDTGSFATTAKQAAIYFPGATGTDNYTINTRLGSDALPAGTDVLTYYAKKDSCVVYRATTNVSGLKFSVQRSK
jgi:hypothetical protein